MFNKFLVVIFALAAIATAFVYTNVAKASPPVTDNLISYWTFDTGDITDETVTDVWGDNDGTIMGDRQIVEGHIDDALKFDGEDDYIEIPESETLDITDVITVEAWMKTSKKGDYAGIVTKWNSGNGGDAGQAFSLLMDITGAGGFLCNADNQADNFLHGVEEINDGQWHHVVATADRGGGTNNLKLYVDGVLDAEVPASGTIITLTNTLVMIGTHDITAGVKWFDGLIDEVRIYNQVLSEDEIQHNLEAGGLAVESTNKLPLTWGKIKASR